MSQVLQSNPADGQERAGLVYHRGYFSKDAQLALVDEIAQIISSAPLFQPTMPRTGKPFSVMMTNCGSLGWVSDRSGYRYQPRHPATGGAWPTMPSRLISLWHAVAGFDGDPEACLINIYPASAKMGSHQDRDEAEFSAPVVSISLGDDATFHVGGVTRGGPKTRYRLASGDVIVLGGASRLAFHGVDKIHPATSMLDLSGIADGCCRINLTLRRVSVAS